MRVMRDSGPKLNCTVIGHGMVGDEYEGRVTGKRSMGLMLWMTENEGDGDRGKDDNLHRWGMEQKKYTRG